MVIKVYRELQDAHSEPDFAATWRFAWERSIRPGLSWVFAVMYDTTLVKLSQLSRCTQLDDWRNSGD